MLRLRILSALVGIPLVLGVVYLGGPWYAVFLLITANLGMREYGALLKAKGSRMPPGIGYCGVTALIVLLYYQQLQWVFPLIMLLFILLFAAVLLYFERVNFWESALFLWGIIYLGGLCGFLLLLRLFPAGAFYTVLLLIGVWSNDTFAYFIGSKWGRHKLAPAISPHKSVEGSLAGIGGTLLLAAAAAWFFPGQFPLPLGQALILAAGIAVFAQLGDLMESALKRHFQVKDSGNLIPGHGGVLDRIDSVMLTAPFVYTFFYLIELVSR
ncbi:MAG: phosphatidate cytidylyltransferase [Bacillota bacterium]